VRDRPFARWWPIALGVVAALVGGVVVGGVVVGASLVGIGVRRLALRGWPHAAGVGVLVAVPSALAPWVLAAVVA